MVLEDKIEICKKALLKVIAMNRQQAADQYGNAEKAESWACVEVCRKALSEIELPDSKVSSTTSQNEST